jgi:hypothetical protein
MRQLCKWSYKSQIDGGHRWHNDHSALGDSKEIIKLKIGRANRVFVNFAADRFAIKINRLFREYRASFLARPPFFIKASSTIGTASAIVLRPSVRPMGRFGGVSPLRTGAGATVINNSDQVI